MKRINIVKMQLEDTKKIRDIAVESFQEDLVKSGSLPPGIDNLKWHTSKVENGLYYKILSKEQIIGGINLYKWKEDHFSLGAIFILPEFQSKGIGSYAMDFIEEEFSQVKKWTLETPAWNKKNHRFYERHGYSKAGEFQPDKESDFTLFIFKKEIG